MQYLNIAAVVVSGAAALSAAIAKATSNKKDDKIAGWLSKAEKVVRFVGLQTPAIKKEVGVAGRDSARRVIDRRRGKK